MNTNGHTTQTIAQELLAHNPQRFGTILADPPWRFNNRTGKMAPEHRRLARYATMTLQDVKEMPVAQLALQKSHLYLWVPNALVKEGLEVRSHRRVRILAQDQRRACVVEEDRAEALTSRSGGERGDSVRDFVGSPSLGLDAEVVLDEHWPPREAHPTLFAALFEIDPARWP